MATAKSTKETVKKTAKKTTKKAPARKPAKTTHAKNATKKVPAKTAAKKHPPAKKKPGHGKPPSRPSKPPGRGTPYIITLDANLLTLKQSGSDDAVAYEVLLFIDESKFSETQRTAIAACLGARGLRELRFAIGKAWGAP